MSQGILFNVKADAQSPYYGTQTVSNIHSDGSNPVTVGREIPWRCPQVARERREYRFLVFNKLLDGDHTRHQQQSN